MKTFPLRYLALCLAIFALPASSETLSEYVNTCEQKLGFASADINNAAVLDCNNAIAFAPNQGSPDPENDYVGYLRVNDVVDLVFACRWIIGNNGFKPPFLAAASIELMIHNRQNGNTCYFSALPQPIELQNQTTLTDRAPTAIVPPTDAAHADGYWKAPADLDATVPCADCHVAGPYIASPRIALSLARFGLLNNGHDTNATRYHAVGTTFAHFNTAIASFNVPSAMTCANGCHSIAYGSTATNVEFENNANAPLLPAISNVITDVASFGVMPANNPVVDNNPSNSNYTWINRTNPFSSSSTGDVETLAGARSDYSTLLSYCPAPAVIEAHVVGSNNNFIVSQQSNFGLLPDKLSVFNLRDGLVCLNSDQEPGQQCHNYSTRYLCNGTWTSWYNTDSPSGDGDHEERSRDQNLCASPTAIEATTTINGLTLNSFGPNDRLAQFSPYGLVCNNADQPDGKCSNYVVRFESCTQAPKRFSAHITSVWSGMQLTASATQNDASVKAQPFNSSWNSQSWNIIPVSDTGYVQIQNTWTGTYLNDQSQADKANVVTYALNSSWLSEQWIIEPVPGSNTDVRIKNVWSGRYLNVVDQSNFSNVLSQTRNTGWLSERWRIN